MRFFTGKSSFFCIIPTIAVNAEACQCGNPECPGGWSILLMWAGFLAGISIPRTPRAPQP